MQCKLPRKILPVALVRIRFEIVRTSSRYLASSLPIRQDERSADRIPLSTVARTGIQRTNFA